MLLKVVVLSVIIERIWEHTQQAIGDDRLSKRVKIIGSAVISVAAAVTLQLDLLYGLEVMPSATVPGFILTGLVLSLGSNVVHDLIDIVNGLSTKHKAIEG